MLGDANIRITHSVKFRSMGHASNCTSLSREGWRVLQTLGHYLTILASESKKIGEVPSDGSGWVSEV